MVFIRHRCHRPHGWEEPGHPNPVCSELGENANDNDNANRFTESMQLETLFEDPVTPCVLNRRRYDLVCNNPGNSFESYTQLSSETTTTFHPNSNEAAALSQEQCPVSTTSTTTTAGSMTGGSTSALTFLGTTETARGTTAAGVSTSSLTFNINMNRTDEVGALDRLRSDLSQDEVSMLIGIFGPTKQRDARLPTEPVSRPSTCPAPPNQSQNAALPIALSFVHHYHNVHNHFYPAIERPGFNRSGMVLRGRPGPELVTPTITQQITQEAINILSQHPVSMLPMQVLGAPLSATLAKEQQRANKRRKKDILLPKPLPLLPLLAPKNKMTSNIRNNDDRPPSLAPSPKTRAKLNVPRKAVLPSKANFASSSTSTATTVTTTVARRSKVVSVKMKKPKSNTTSKSPQITQPVETYITRPKRMNEGVWTQRLEEAREFVLKHGHGRIPTTYPSNPDLANWAKRQRYYYKIFKKHVLDRPNNPAIAPTKCLNTIRRNRMNKQYTNGYIRHNKPGTRSIKCLMTSERFARLEAIEFCMDLQAGVWECNYRSLCDYAMQNNGHTSPSKHTQKELSKWVGTQRYQMRLRKKREGGETNLPDMPCLNLERIAKLNKIDFFWDDEDERSRS